MEHIQIRIPPPESVMTNLADFDLGGINFLQIIFGNKSFKFMWGENHCWVQLDFLELFPVELEEVEEVPVVPDEFRFLKKFTKN